MDVDNILANYHHHYHSELFNSLRSFSVSFIIFNFTKISTGAGDDIQVAGRRIQHPYPITMYNGIGLASVRGTATSGHVQSNAGHVRNSSRRNRTFRNANDGRDENRHGSRGGRGGGRGHFDNRGNNNERHALLTNEALREGASSLALHEKKRRLEVRLMELRDQLEERGWKE